MQVERLRLVGFKSFVDVVELEVKSGLTGIVGPNGCGKSNLAEALRWVMGESSARHLRGGEMDDLIFAGSARRPARNIAEVALTLDNSARTAPRAFNDRDEIEVVRRVERGAGSVFRINGREVRGRDVQLLFADAATGGHFSTVIGQGRVGALIEAKPAERRLLLEEAAGTAGHPLRRREALSRLTAAEVNLVRLDDVVAGLLAQLETVKRQARQAQRYRRLAEEIRRHEVLLFRARRREGEAEAVRAETDFAAIEAAVAALAEEAAAAQHQRAEVEAQLPALRLAETTTAGELQRLVEARAELERELQRVVAVRGDTERRQVQLAADLESEDGQLADAQSALARLLAERDALAGAAVQDSDREAAALRLAAMSEALVATESEWQRAAEADAQAAARRTAAERRCRDLAGRRADLETRRTDMARQRTALAVDAVPRASGSAAAAAVAAAESRVEEAGAAVESAERAVALCQELESAALDLQQQTAARHARLTAEAEALKAVLAPTPGTSTAAPILASLRVVAGFEAAAGALFDDDLAAPLGPTTDAACCWIDLPAVAGAVPLPKDACPLTAAVTAPSALGRRLAQSGWVKDEATGRRLQPELLPGQRLVDREGRLWRWDGFTRNAPARSAAARHLELQQRLTIRLGEIAQSDFEQGAAETAVAAARADRDQAVAALRSAQGRHREVEAALAAARTAEAALVRRALAAESRLAALEDAATRLAADLAETEAVAEENERDLASLPAPALLRTTLEKARAAATDARRHEAEVRGTLDRLSQVADARRERLAALDLEERSWRKRVEAASAHRLALQQRRTEQQWEIDALTGLPARIAAQTDALGTCIAKAAVAARRAADALARGEVQLREAVQNSQAADQDLATARERRARLEVLRDAANEALARLDREISERLGDPETLAGPASRTADAQDPGEIARRRDRLSRERDAIGPVNLLAENEAAEISARVRGHAARARRCGRSGRQVAPRHRHA